MAIDTAVPLLLPSPVAFSGPGRSIETAGSTRPVCSLLVPIKSINQSINHNFARPIFRADGPQRTPASQPKADRHAPQYFCKKGK